MTREEKRDPNALVREPGRVKRIARGSGCPDQAVTELVQKFLFMRQMMGGMGGDLGMMGKIPGLKNLAMARNVRRAMKSGKMPPGMGMPGMPGMGMPGMGMPGMGMPGMGFPGAGFGEGGGSGAPRMRQLSKTEKNARKNQRKRERDSRKKNRGK
jgi:signal recognition particle subunit SRP54